MYEARHGCVSARFFWHGTGLLARHGSVARHGTVRSGTVVWHGTARFFWHGSFFGTARHGTVVLVLCGKEQYGDSRTFDCVRSKAAKQPASQPASQPSSKAASQPANHYDTQWSPGQGFPIGTAHHGTFGTVSFLARHGTVRFGTICFWHGTARFLLARFIFWLGTARHGTSLKYMLEYTYVWHTVHIYM